MPEPTNLALERIIRGLESLRNEATGGGDDLAVLAYLIDMALIEAREQAKGQSRNTADESI